MISYKELPDHTRVWVYQSNRTFTADEITQLNAHFAHFVDGWAAHGAALRACIELFYDRFICVFVDEKQAMATGCSIDKSVHFVKALEQEFGVQLMDRMQLAWKDGEEVKVAPMPIFESKVEAGEITADTIVFNNLTPDKGSFIKEWEVPLAQSWHARMLPA